MKATIVHDTKAVVIEANSFMNISLSTKGLHANMQLAKDGTLKVRVIDRQDNRTHVLLDMSTRPIKRGTK